MMNRVQGLPGAAESNAADCPENAREPQKGFCVPVHFALCHGCSFGRLGGGWRRDKMTLLGRRFGTEKQRQIGADMANPGQGESKPVKPICRDVN